MQTSGLFLTVFCLSAGMETKLLRHIQDGDEPSIVHTLLNTSLKPHTPARKPPTLQVKSSLR